MRHRRLRPVRLLLSCALAAALLGLGAGAQEEVPEGEIWVEGQADLVQAGSFADPSAESADLQEADAPDTLYDTLYQGLSDWEGRIDLTHLNISYVFGDAEQNAQVAAMVNATFTQVVNDHPELFYVDRSYRYSASGNRITYLEPVYSAQYTRADVAVFEARVEEFLAQVVDEEMNNVERLLAIHDALALQCAYNWEVDTTGQAADRGVYNAYGALVEGDAVCQGYALAYQLLVQRQGIGATITTSDEMNHAWNLVQLGGNWYHVDVTWDDPVPDTPGRDRHTYFLLDDAAMLENDHYGWDSTLECSDGRYTQNWPFCGSSYPFYWSREQQAFYWIDGEDSTVRSGRLRQAGDGGTPVGQRLRLASGSSVLWQGDSLYYIRFSGGGEYDLMQFRLSDGLTAALSRFAFAQTGVPEYEYYYDAMGLRLDGDGTGLEVCSATRRTVEATALVPEASWSWTEEVGRTAALQGAAESQTGRLWVGLTAPDSASGTAGTLGAAFYQGEQMRELHSAPITLLGGRQWAALEGPEGTWDRMTLFLVDGQGNWRPLCSSQGQQAQAAA